MRRLVVTLLVLFAVLVVADRLAVSAAQRDVAQRLQVEQHLDHRPDVSIRGFPFLTQLVGGRYDEVDVTVRGLHAGPLAVSRVVAHLHGVHVSLGDVVRQHVSRVPIDRASAEVVLSFGDLNTFLLSRQSARISAAGGKVHLSDDFGGLHVDLTLPIEVRGDAIVIRGSGPLPDLTIPSSGLPFHLRLDSVQVGRNGLVVTGSAAGLVLRT
ncbi:MAG: DUF2993 domain-containing protein [Frankiales bacterium]|nr:DUF2993 domain-containing protein [Frankiales bacterium]